MKIKELKDLIMDLPDDGEVLAEEKIHGVDMPFEMLMWFHVYGDNVYFGLK